MYLIIDKVDGHLEENNGNKYLLFDLTELHSTDENKEVLKKYTELWDVTKSEIETKMVVEKVNMTKILWKSNLIQTTICHWINH